MKDFLKLNHEINKKNKEAQQYAEISVIWIKRNIKIWKGEYSFEKYYS